MGRPATLCNSLTEGVGGGGAANRKLGHGVGVDLGVEAMLTVVGKTLGLIGG